jgi:hypothetical protein
MVTGIISDVIFFSPFLGLVCGIVGLVLSSVAWRKISTGAASPDGKGFAITGFVTSVVSVALWIFVIILIGSLIAAGS